jgi:hypothetical protein
MQLLLVKSRLAPSRRVLDDSASAEVEIVHSGSLSPNASYGQPKGVSVPLREAQGRDREA